MVLVDPEDSSWVVTCEHCGEDLTRDYVPQPVVLHADFTEGTTDEFVRRLKAMEMGRNIARALLLDQELPPVDEQLVLQVVLFDHASHCGKAPPRTAG